MKKEKVAILGASDNPERYAYRAFIMLREHGHEPIPVHPKLAQVEGVAVKKTLGEIQDKVDTLTLYVNPQISSGLAQEIITLHPARVIFNPGSENPELAKKLNAAGITSEEACTLVLLRTNQF